MTALLLLVLTGYPQVMEQKGCATCHLAGHPEANAKALKVFDLKHEHWPRELQEAQVPKVRGRLEGKAATEAEIAEVMRFVEAERRAEKRP
ncbi:MAG: hypothetical protein QM723_14595 [Myxococcaceae bacterium]